MWWRRGDKARKGYTKKGGVRRWGWAGIPVDTWPASEEALGLVPASRQRDRDRSRERTEACHERKGEGQQSASQRKEAAGRRRAGPALLRISESRKVLDRAGSGHR